MQFTSSWSEMVLNCCCNVVRAYESLQINTMRNVDFKKTRAEDVRQSEEESIQYTRAEAERNTWEKFHFFLDVEIAMMDGLNLSLTANRLGEIYEVACKTLSIPSQNRAHNKKQRRRRQLTIARNLEAMFIFMLKKTSDDI